MKASVLFLIGALLLGLANSVSAQDANLDDDIDAQLDDINLGAEKAAETVTPKKAEPPAGAMTESIEAAPPAVSEPAPPVAEAAAAQDNAAISDEPNLKYERRLHDIFVKTQSEPVSDDKWAGMIGSRRSENYGIQAGDTLWDMSETFFGDGHYWPKLWSENSAIENPHRIVPGHVIVFVAGSEASAPQIEVRESAPPPQTNEADSLITNTAVSQTHNSSAPEFNVKTGPDEAAAGTVLEEAEIDGQPEIPAPPPDRHRLLKHLPPSFVSFEPASTNQFDSTGLSVIKRKAVEETPIITPGFYLDDQMPQSVGVISEIEKSEKVASTGQSLFVKMKSPVQVGERFSVLIPRGNIETSKGPIGPIIEVGGLIQIDQPVDEKRKIYRARVVEAVNPVAVGGLVTIEPLIRVSMKRNADVSNIQVQVIGAQQDNERKIIGSGSAVYLDGGAAAGLKNGQILALRAVRKAHWEKTSLPDFAPPSAVLKVVRVDHKVATAIVLETHEEIVPGDITGGPLPTVAEPLKSEIHVEQLGSAAPASPPTTEAPADVGDSSAAPVEDKIDSEDIDSL